MSRLYTCQDSAMGISMRAQLIKKHQTHITSMDDQILSLYAKGMTNRKIVAFFREMCDEDVSAFSISKVREWQKKGIGYPHTDTLTGVLSELDFQSGIHTILRNA